MPHPLVKPIKAMSKALDALIFSGQVKTIYNPLEYAWEPHLQYLERYGSGTKRVLFLGMNPGPYGMVQTGVPFGEVDIVKNWLGIQASVQQPKSVHPKRPVQGFECTKSEVSGRRLWGMIADRFEHPEAFFADAFVVNFCPLVWMTESGKNITPDKLPSDEMAPVYEICNQHLQAVIEYYQPEILVGVGAFAEKQLRTIHKHKFSDAQFNIGRMLHPSPASPLANKHWPERAISDLIELGVW